MLALDMLRGAADAGAQPTLDLNFTSGTLDSRVTYTGASLATLTDATGAIAYKPHNLFLWSNDLNNADWLKIGATTTANAGVDPLGGSTATRVQLSAGDNFVYKGTANPGAGVAYAQAYWVKSNTGSSQTFRIFGDGTAARSADFTATTSWQQFTFSRTAVVGTSLGLCTGSGGAAADILVCYAQLNVGPLQPYYPTTSAAYYGPRFTYDPVTHAALGLLIEEQRTNLLTRSEVFDNAAWPLSGSTVTANATTGPDGNATADKLVESVGAGAHLLNRAGATVSVASVLSVYAKAAERTQIALQLGADVGYYNLSTGAVISGANASIVNVGNGWYRCILTGTPVNTNSLIYLASGGAASYIGDGTSGVYIWGAQLEAGTFATSYIPTTSASVTRAADSATMTGSNFSSWFNASAGTFVVDAQFGVVGPPSDLILAHDGSTTNSVGIYMSSSKPNQAVNAGGVSQTVQASGSAWTLGATSKVAASFGANDFRTSNNGAAVVTDSVGSMPSGLNAFSLGGSGAVLYAGTKLNATIARLRYYNTALTNAQLQALTT